MSSIWYKKSRIIKEIRECCTKGSPLSLASLIYQAYDLNISVKDFRDKTPMSIAISYNYLPLIDYLMDNGFYCQRDLTEVLKFAIKKGYPGLIMKLSDFKFDFTYMDNYAMKRACELGKLEIVKCLVFCKVDITLEDNTPLRLACGYLNYDLIKYLVENGADVKVNDNQPLRVAASANKLELVKFLVKNGASIQCMDYEPIRVSLRYRRVSDYLVGYLVNMKIVLLRLLNKQCKLVNKDLISTVKKNLTEKIYDHFT